MIRKLLRRKAPDRTAQRQAAAKLEQERIRTFALEQRDYRSHLHGRQHDLETRRLLILGTYLNATTGDDQEKRNRLFDGLDAFLDRPRERELFGFLPLPPTCPHTLGGDSLTTHMCALSAGFHPLTAPLWHDFWKAGAPPVRRRSRLPLVRFSEPRRLRPPRRPRHHDRHRRPGRGPQARGRRSHWRHRQEARLSLRPVLARERDTPARAHHPRRRREPRRLGAPGPSGTPPGPWRSGPPTSPRGPEPRASGDGEDHSPRREHQPPVLGGPRPMGRTLQPSRSGFPARPWPPPTVPAR